LAHPGLAFAVRASEADTPSPLGRRIEAVRRYLKSRGLPEANSPGSLPASASSRATTFEVFVTGEPIGAPPRLAALEPK
jgi:hypothetical protein